MDFASLSCNVTHGVDQGGHAHKFLYYTNQSDKLADGDPPEWKSAVYLWNYCDAAWDLAWEHTYRADKIDCSVPGAGCAWWGPSIEIFGDAPYPQMAELGYEDSLLYHDGLWSELRPPEANFRDPAIWAPTTPWQLFHLDPNRSYGVGNWFDQNDPPTIDGQEEIETREDQAVTVSAGSLLVSDADVDIRFHVAYSISLYPGDNYVHSGQIVTPTENFNGQLMVPVTINDGAADSQLFELRIDVTPVNDPPVIVGQEALETEERTPLTITVQNLQVTDPDNEISDLDVAVQDGVGYQRVNNTITPEPGVIGDLWVGVVADDGDLQSAVFPVLVEVAPDITPPELTLLGSPTVTLQMGDAYTDAGASAVDNLDGDITARIVTMNPVDTSRTGTYMVTYSVADRAGNNASITRTVIVQAADVSPDLTPPVLTLRGPSIVTLQVGDVYADAGASAVDNLDGDLTARIVTVNPVDTSRIGNYVVTYTVSDLAGNTASIGRTVIVQATDVVAPVLTLRGPSTMTLQVGDFYADAGASAMDNRDGDITARVVTVNPVDTSRAGTYLVTYSVSDRAGNNASIARTVIVRARPRHNGGGGIDVAVPLLLMMITCMRRLSCGRDRGSPVTCASPAGRA
jgi:hypothetical protein